MRKQSRKWFCFLLFTLVLFGVLAGCGKEKKEKEGDFGHLSENFSFFKSVGWCDKGYIAINQSTINFTEFATQKTYPLCSKAYCTHEPWNPVTNPDPECEATLQNIEKVCVRGDEIFTFQNLEWGKTCVMVRNLFEHGYKKLVDLPYVFDFLSYHLIIGDHAYLFMGEAPVDNGSGAYSNNDILYVLVELNLTTGEYKEKLRLSGEKHFQFFRESFSQDGIYIYCYYDKSSLDEDFVFELFDYAERGYFVPFNDEEPKLICEDYFAQINKDSVQTSKDKTLFVNSKGVYVTDYTSKVTLHSNTNVETDIISLKEGDISLGNIDVSGDILHVTVTKKDNSKENHFINLMDGSDRVLSGEHSYYAINAGLFSIDGSISEGKSYAIIDMSGTEEKGRMVMEIGQ